MILVTKEDEEDKNMFDLADDSFDLEPLQLSGSSPIESSTDDYYLTRESPSSSSISSSPGEKVFGSFLVDRNSSTPYTDATQVMQYPCAGPMISVFVSIRDKRGQKAMGRQYVINSYMELALGSGPYQYGIEQTVGQTKRRHFIYHLPATLVSIFISCAPVKPFSSILPSFLSACLPAFLPCHSSYFMHK